LHFGVTIQINLLLAFSLRSSAFARGESAFGTILCGWRLFWVDAYGRLADRSGIDIFGSDLSGLGVFDLKLITPVWLARGCNFKTDRQ